MDKPVIIFGSKGIGKAALEIFKSNGVVVYGFLEDDDKVIGQEIDDVTVLGRADDHGFLKLIGQKCEAFVATDENMARKKWVNYLMDERKVMPVNAVHQTAIISQFASIGHGNFINARATVGTGTKIGQHCVIHSAATIEHDVTIGDYVQIGAGAVISSGCEVENGAFIGSGVTLVGGVKVGKGARVGAGSVVVSNVNDKETVFGNPAMKVAKT